MMELFSISPFSKYSGLSSLKTSAQGWCTGKAQRDWVERDVEGGIRMGNTCKPKADSCQCGKNHYNIVK